MLQRRLTDVERTETTAGPEPREGSHHTQVFHHTVGYSMQKLKTSKQQFLDRFSRELDAIEAKAPMQGSYERIKPYIVDHQVGGQDFEFIIYHKESESWFGGNGGDASLQMYKDLCTHILKKDNIKQWVRKTKNSLL